MKGSTIEYLEAHFRKHPFLAATVVPMSEVRSLEGFTGFPLPDDYMDFVHRFGGAIVGPYPIFGLRTAETMGDADTAIEVTNQFRADDWPGTREWLVISVDHGGNPIGLDKAGKVWISDHDFGAIEVVAESFEGYVERRCLGSVSDGGGSS